MNTIQQKDLITPKQEDSSYRELNGKLELALKLMNVIINISISESKKIDKKQKTIEFYNKLFTYEENELLRTFHKYISNELLNNLKQTQFDTKFIKFILELWNLFINEKIKIESLLDGLINILESTIHLVKKNNSNNLSIQIIDEFYEYLNNHLDIIQKTKNVLNKILEEKEKELDNESKNTTDLSTNNNSYKESSTNLSDKTQLMEKDKNSKIEEQNENINHLQSVNEQNSEGYNSAIEEITKIIKEINEESKIKINELQKSNEDMRNKIKELETLNAQFAKEKEENNNSINELVKFNKELKNKINNFENKINELEKSNEENKRKIKHLEKSKEKDKNLIDELEKINVKFDKEKEDNKKTLNELLKIIAEHEKNIGDNKRNIEILNKGKKNL